MGFVALSRMSFSEQRSCESRDENVNIFACLAVCPEHFNRPYHNSRTQPALIPLSFWIPLQHEHNRRQSHRGGSKCQWWKGHGYNFGIARGHREAQLRGAGEERPDEHAAGPPAPCGRRHLPADQDRPGSSRRLCLGRLVYHLSTGRLTHQTYLPYLLIENHRFFRRFTSTCAGTRIRRSSAGSCASCSSCPSMPPTPGLVCSSSTRTMCTSTSLPCATATKVRLQ